MLGVVQAEQMAVVAAMKSLYWPAKNDLAHATKYQPLLKLLVNVNCSFVESLRLGANTTYTSEMIMLDFISLMASQVEKQTLGHFKITCMLPFMCDESTNVSVLKQLVLCGRYLDDSADTQTVFLQIKDLFNGQLRQLMLLL